MKEKLEQEICSDWDFDVLADAARTHGTPLYVYDLGRLRKRIKELRSAFAGMPHQLYFATMANDQPKFLRALAQQGIGACVNSIPHLMLALEAGFSPEKIQFTSTGIAIDDMRILNRMGIAANLDSIQQLETWFKIGAVAGGLRINAGSLISSSASDRIGVAASETWAAIGLAKRLGGRIDGLHIYVGTNFQTHQHMVPTLSAFFDLAAKCDGLRYLNIGGGIGVNYLHSGDDFDVASFGKDIASLVQKMNAARKEPLEIIIEPGRGIAATSGVFVTMITDVKHLSGIRYITVDGSVAVFPRPFHHPDPPHRIRFIEKKDQCSPLGAAVIVGRTTFSRDVIGASELPEKLQPGDFLVIDDAGAYSQSMKSNFLGQPCPESVYLESPPN